MVSLKPSRKSTFAGVPSDEDAEDSALTHNLPNVEDFTNAFEALKRDRKPPPSTSGPEPPAPAEPPQKPGLQQKQLQLPEFQLTRKQQDEIRAAFALFDSEGSGFMEIGDLKVLLRSLGFEPTESDIRVLLVGIGLADAEKLCFTDFLNLILYKLRETDCMEDIVKSFQALDRDHSGFITFDDFKAVAEDVDEDLNVELLKEMWMLTDRDGDNAVDLEEFYKTLKGTF